MYNIINLYLDGMYSEFSLIKKYNIGMQQLNIYIDSILMKIVYLKDGKIHRENKPAKIEYYKNGNIREEQYCINGKFYREDDGPEVLEYYDNGNIKYIEHFKKCNYFKENKPFAIGYYENNKVKELFFYDTNNGKNGIEVVEYYENGIAKIKEHYSNNAYHYNNGPAVMKYYINGKIQSEEYYIHGALHREDGPAQIKYHENGNIKRRFYYINSKNIIMEQYDNFDYNKMNKLIIEFNNINSLLELKLIVNIKFNKNKELLDLIESKLIMLKLM